MSKYGEIPLEELTVGKTYLVVSVLHGFIQDVVSEDRGKLKSICDGYYAFELEDGTYHKWRGSEYVDAHHFWYCLEDTDG